MSVMRAVLQKELWCQFRDPRLVTLLMVPLVLGPVILYAFTMLKPSHGLTPKTAGRPVQAAVLQGTQLPDSLRAALDSAGVVIVELPDERTALAQKKALILPQGRLDEVFHQNQKVSVVFDSRSDTVRDVAVVVGAIHAWGQGIAAERIRAAGLTPDVIEPVDIVPDDRAPQATAEKLALWSAMILLVTVWPVASGGQAAVDAGAGEKEHFTLEPLLTTSASPGAIVAGKFLAILAVSSLAAILAVLPGVALILFWDRLALLRPILTPFALLALAFCALTVSAIASALSLLMSIFARGTRESAAYTALVGLLCMAPVFVLYMSGGKGYEKWWHLVPIGGPAVFLRDALFGSANPRMSIVIGCITAACVWLSLGLAASYLRREAVVRRL